MKRWAFRVGAAVLAACAIVQAASADLPRLNLQAEADGSLAATMGMSVKIWCDREHQQLVFDYVADVPVSANDVLGFVDDPFANSNAEVIEMRVTSPNPGQLSGTAPVDDKLLRILQARDMAIIAPTEMGEPLYTGRSEALLRVATACRV
jgi:hypothetical protein